MKYNRIISLSVFCLFLMNFQCDEDDDLLLSACDAAVILDNMMYQTIESDFYTLTSAEINGDCLSITISASGCDGSTWALTLLDSEAIAESLPPQRFIKLNLANNEACLAVFTKEQSFDITELRIDDANEVLLNIEEFSEPLVYTY